MVAAFIFNGGEGSQWATPVACHVMAAYFGVGQYAEGLTRTEWEEILRSPDQRACETYIQDANRYFVPIVEPAEFAPESDPLTDPLLAPVETAVPTPEEEPVQEP